MKPLKTSFKQSFNIIKERKKIFLTLFFLQLLFFSSIFFINLHYMPRIIEKSTLVFDYISKQNPEDKDNMLGDDPLMISRNYKAIQSYLKPLIIFCFLSFVLINGLIWYLCNKLVFSKKLFDKKELLKYYSRFFVISLVSFILIINFLYSSFKGLFTFSYDQIGSFNFAAFLFTLFLVYFLFISYSSILKFSLKNSLKKSFQVGLRKIHLFFIAYLIIFILIFSLFILINMLLEKNLFLLTLVLILFITAFVWSKIFLISLVKTLLEEPM